MSYFILITLLLNIMPGPAMVYVVNSSLSRNIKHITLSILGIECGTLLHILASGFGLTVMLSKIPVFLLIAKYCCGLFLTYLGITQFKKGLQNIAMTSHKLELSSLRSAFVHGAIINTLNPKIIVFFVTFLPQFIQIESKNTSFYIVCLGSLFGLFGAVVNVALSILIGISLKKIQRGQQPLTISKGVLQLIGCTYILFGIAVLLSRN